MSAFAELSAEAEDAVAREVRVGLVVSDIAMRWRITEARALELAGVTREDAEARVVKRLEVLAPYKGKALKTDERRFYRAVDRQVLAWAASRKAVGHS